MNRRTLDEWLRWQESLHPREIDLGLGRVQEVLGRLPIEPPDGRVFTIAGTNGKGSTAAALAAVLRQGNFEVGVYSSPHLVRYNERVRIGDRFASDDDLVDAFERVEAARDGQSLTFFEFGTLAAFCVFTRQRCDAWVLEVGMGGRLDAVNVIDPSCSVITTIGMDHEAWLGDSIEAIAAEKAGVLRPGVPAIFGAATIPETIVGCANEIRAPLRHYGGDFRLTCRDDRYTWSGVDTSAAVTVQGAVVDDAGRQNIATALAAVECVAPQLISAAGVEAAIGERLPGRFQRVAREQEWILDVAHNLQAVELLVQRLRKLEPATTTGVIALLGDKRAADIAAAFAGCVDRWIVATLDDTRAADPEILATRLRAVSESSVSVCASVELALQAAADAAPRNSRILVCGSFRIVGPALQWLGIED